MSVVRVRVEVFEDDVKVGALDIGYYPTQEYAVEITTPDGTDVKFERIAGKPLEGT